MLLFYTVRMMNELKEKRKLYIDSVGKMEFESKEVNHNERLFKVR